MFEAGEPLTSRCHDSIKLGQIVYTSLSTVYSTTTLHYSPTLSIHATDPPSIITHLQTAAVHHLVVHSQLPALVVDNKHSYAAPAILEAILQSPEQVALVEDRQSLLNIASLGHGDHTPVITDVEHAVLLKDRAEHVLDNDRWAGVGDERALLVQLLGEQINTEVAVLAGLSGGRDADDLARTALQDQEIANADVVAGDGDGVGWATRGVGVVVRGAGLGVIAATGGRHADFAVLDDDVLFYNAVGVLVVVVLVSAVKRVDDAVGGAVETVAERVIVSVLVVISHIKAVLTVGDRRWSVDGSARGGNLLVKGDGFAFGVAGFWVVAGVGALVLPGGVALVFLSNGNGSAVAVVSLGYVDAGVEVGGTLTVGGTEVTVVRVVFDVDLSVGVT